LAGSNDLTIQEAIHLYISAWAAPFQKILDSPTGAKFFAAGFASLQWVTQGVLNVDLFILVWVLLLGISGWDYFIGGRRAHMARRFNDDISRAKLLGKVNGLAMMWFVYAAESLVARAGFDTHSLAAASLTALLIIEEARSLNRHHKALLGTPIPMLGELLDGIGGAITRRVSFSPKHAAEEGAVPPDPSQVELPLSPSQDGVG